jgi:hypothetical protein
VPERNPAELLASAKLRKIIESLRGFGWLVLIDTPPARSLADALSLANCSDAVLLVARSRTSRAHALGEVADGLQRVDHRVVGAVLVDASSSAMNRRDLRRSMYGRYVGGFPTTPAARPPADGDGNENRNAPALGDGRFRRQLDQQPQPRPGQRPQHPQPPDSESEGIHASSPKEGTA